MKRIFTAAMVASALLATNATYAQIQDEENVTITMELVPILELNMNTPDQIDFVFDEVYEYMGGITQYGGTILTVSSTVSWDLYASGTSSRHAANATDQYWDNPVMYGVAPQLTAGTGTAGAYVDLPLQLLELHQFPADANEGAGTGPDYGPAFQIDPTAVVNGQNNIYVDAVSAYGLPAATENYIAGHNGLTEFVSGGSYLTAGNVGLNANGGAYYFVIDYRIVPGLPAIFPYASNKTTALDLVSTEAVGAYAHPGVYTMNAKYLLIENQ